MREQEYRSLNNNNNKEMLMKTMDLLLLLLLKVIREHTKIKGWLVDVAAQLLDERQTLSMQRGKKTPKQKQQQRTNENRRDLPRNRVQMWYVAECALSRDASKVQIKILVVRA